jgi:hypothetical protein
VVSHIWDNCRIVRNMVTPHMARPTGELMNPLADCPTATLHVADYDIGSAAGSSRMARLSPPPTSELAAELDGAASWLGLAPDEILLAALGRTIARVIGDGVTTVDVADDRNWLRHAVLLTCATSQQASATEVLGGVHRALAAPSHSAHASSEILLNYVGAVAEESMPTHETPPGLGHALELRVYSAAGLLHVDWWYDTSRFERYTVEELTEQFPFALFEMTSDAAAPL